jgi:hypothetical protein
VLTKDYASVVEVITSVLTVHYLNRRHVPDLHQHPVHSCFALLQ